VVHFGALGDNRAAEEQWQAALKENPAFTPAVIGLADICLREQRLAEVRDLSQKLQALAHNGLDV
jgi:hypothetical protein